MSGTTSQSPADAFIESVVTEYQDLYAEIGSGEGNRKEYDLMPRLIQHLFLGALGYSATDYEQEDQWNDIRFYDDDRNPVIIVEGKRRDIDVSEGIPQAFAYAAETTYVRYIIVTNIDKMRVYRRCDEGEADETHHGVSGKLIADIEFEGIVNTASGAGIADTLSLDDRQAIQQLMQLREQEISDPDRYDKSVVENFP